MNLLINEIATTGREKDTQILIDTDLMAQSSNPLHKTYLDKVNQQMAVESENGDGEQAYGLNFAGDERLSGGLYAISKDNEFFFKGFPCYVDAIIDVFVA